MNRYDEKIIPLPPELEQPALEALIAMEAQAVVKVPASAADIIEEKAQVTEENKIEPEVEPEEEPDPPVASRTQSKLVF